ncbi:MAG: ATPase, T2SS/T4P/T4SS family [Christensenellales bacterium]
MLKDIIPSELYNCLLNNYNTKDIMEIRIRQNKPICVCLNGNYSTLTSQNGKELYADKKLIDYIILRATDSSLYCYNDQLRQFYLTCSGGIRIGICGEVVTENDKIATVKNIYSLTIRIPHEIIGCSNNILNYIYNMGRVKNTLIISPPGMGKTTLLRDLSRSICSCEKIINGLVIDERQELAGYCGREENLNVGNYADVITKSSKPIGIIEGVRSIRPDVIFTDELRDEQDANAVLYAMASGVSVIATVHGDSLNSLTNKMFIRQLLNSRQIENYIFLSNRNGVGTIDAIYNKNLKPVWGDEV